MISSSNRHGVSLGLWLALLILADGSGALTLGRAHLTPELAVPPVHTFRIETGVLGVARVTSLKSGRKGDLWGPYVAVSYAAAPNALLVVDGMAYKRFEADRGEGSAAVGDFVVWGTFVLGSQPGGDAGYGVRFGAKLPNTPSNKDFGTNQTDFFMHLFAGMPWRDWRLSTFGGIGILERPGGEESQDDVVMVGFLAKRSLGHGELGVELEGFSKSRIYGDNWALHGSYELPLKGVLGLLVGGQLSTGDLYGAGELRLGIVLTL